MVGGESKGTASSFSISCWGIGIVSLGFMTSTEAPDRVGTFIRLQPAPRVCRVFEELHAIAAPFFSSLFLNAWTWASVVRDGFLLWLLELAILAFTFILFKI